MAIDQPLEGFTDFLGRKIVLQLANKIKKTPSSSYCGGERTIEFAVKKEFPILGIEANEIRWQHIDSEIRGEPRNVFALMLR